MHPTAVDLSRIANEIVRSSLETAPERNVSVVIADGMVVEGDCALLRIALENLFSNAWKFTSQTPNARIEFGSRIDRSGRRAYFLRDNGAGFDPRHAANLFSPFNGCMHNRSSLAAESDWPLFSASSIDTVVRSRQRLRLTGAPAFISRFHRRGTSRAEPGSSHATKKRGF